MTNGRLLGLSIAAGIALPIARILIARFSGGKLVL